MKHEDKAGAVGRLVAMRDSLSVLKSAFEDIVEVAKQDGATRLALAALMLQESIESFSVELSDFVIKKIAEE